MFVAAWTILRCLAGRTLPRPVLQLYTPTSKFSFYVVRYDGYICHIMQGNLNKGRVGIWISTHLSIFRLAVGILKTIFFGKNDLFKLVIICSLHCPVRLVFLHPKPCHHLWMNLMSRFYFQAFFSFRLTICLFVCLSYNTFERVWARARAHRQKKQNRHLVCEKIRFNKKFRYCVRLRFGLQLSTTAFHSKKFFDKNIDCDFDKFI